MSSLQVPRAAVVVVRPGPRESTKGSTVAEVQRALAFWINGVRYLTAIACGGARYGLDGKTDGVVTDGEAAEARKRLAVRKPRHPGGKYDSVQHAAE
jgi:sRNA-binding protein